MVQFFFDGEWGAQYHCGICGAPCGPKTVQEAVETEEEFRRIFPNTWHLHHRMVTCGPCFTTLRNTQVWDNMPSPWEAYEDDEE